MTHGVYTHQSGKTFHGLFSQYTNKPTLDNCTFSYPTLTPTHCKKKKTLGMIQTFKVTCALLSSSFRRDTLSFNRTFSLHTCNAYGDHKFKHKCHCIITDRTIMVPKNILQATVASRLMYSSLCAVLDRRMTLNNQSWQRVSKSKGYAYKHWCAKTKNKLYQ